MCVCVCVFVYKSRNKSENLVAFSMSLAQVYLFIDPFSYDEFSYGTLKYFNKNSNHNL